MTQETPHLEKTFFPTNDPRHEMLKRIMDNSPEINISMTNSELVKIAIEAIKKSTFTQDDYKNLISKAFENSEKMFRLYAEKLAKVLKEIGTENTVLVSLGSGVQGTIEKVLDANVKEILGKETAMNWIGTDTFNPDNFDDSFFTSDSFRVIPANNTSNLRDILQIPNDKKIFYIANYVFHHMNISFQEFRKLTSSGEKLFLLEEPIEDEKEKDVHHVYSQIAYDVLANVAINPKWAEIFTQDPKAFKVRYLKISEGESSKEKVEFPGTYPLTILYTF